MSDETTPQTPTEGEAPAETAPKAAAEAKAAKPKKEKPPALEDKPFADFINQDFLPKLKQTLTTVGYEDLDLKFVTQKIPIKGLDASWSQVIGTWQGGQRKFVILFSKEDIQAPKYFCAADYGSDPSTLESFMIDERRVTLDLLLLYTTQRLNGQKWLVRN